jgi:hypothetical protein
MRSYTNKASPLSSAYFRMGMLDGHRLKTARPKSDSLFTTAPNTELAFDEYSAGYEAGLDSAPMPTYEVASFSRHPLRGGETRALLNVIKSR